MRKTREATGQKKRTGRGAPDADRFTAKKREQFLRLYAEKVTSVARCAKAVGVSSVTVFNYVRSNPEFAKRYERAQQANTDHAEDLLVEHVLDKNQAGNLIALFGMLRSRRPEKYRDNVKMEHSGQVQVTTAENLALTRQRVQLAEDRPGALN